MSLKYSKQGKSYILPDISGKPQIILPRSDINWLLDQPDNVLSTSAFHYEVLAGEYAFTDPQILRDPYHEHVAHKYLPRRIASTIPEIWDELSNAAGESWGMDTQSPKDVCVFESLMFIIPRITNRTFVGLPLCRNNDYLSSMGKFAMDIIATNTLLGFTPHFIKPIIGPIVAIPNNYHYRKTAKYSKPLIIERLANFQKKREDPSYTWEEPNDYISWHIALATSENRQDELTPDMISKRLLPINFAAIHTTVLTITNCLFDLISSDPSLHYLDGIREEVTRVLAEEGGQWTKSGLARCHRADSAIRESMRVSNFMTRNVLRKVLPKEGIENKAEGWRAPQGAFIGLDMHSVQHDPDIYPNPDTFDAFRFSRHKEESNGDMVGSKDDGQTAQLKNTGLITTSDTFLSFSHGRHACPGRFFVALELKMLLAYMVLNYEVEPIASRPTSAWFGNSRLPPMKEKMRLRRKKGTVPA